MDVFKQSKEYFLEQDQINLNILDQRKGAHEHSTIQDNQYKRALYTIKYGSQINTNNTLKNKPVKNLSKAVTDQFIIFKDEMQICEDKIEKGKNQIAQVKQDYKEGKNLMKECKFVIDAIEKKFQITNERLNLIQSNNSMFQQHASRIRDSME